MKKILQFIKTKVFLKNFAYSIIGLVVFLAITYFGINIYTLHGQSISVPDLTGMNLEKVKEICEEKNLSYEIIDSVFNATVERGTVVTQTPPPEFKVKKKRTLFITTRTFEAEKIIMPNLIDVSLIQAKADLEMYGLKLGNLEYKPDIAKNSVLDQQFEGKPIKAGAIIEKGSKIDLVLGKGIDRKATSVPNLLQMKLDKAENLLKDMYLNYGAVFCDESIITKEDSLNAHVWKQDPSYGRSIHLGAVVDIWLTTDSTKTEEK